MAEAWYKSVKIGNQGQLLAYEKKLPAVNGGPRWLFRGMPELYSLQTSLERLLTDAGVDLANAPEYERRLLKDFKRRAHHYLDQVSSDGDLMGWLALMQHYGAPTRLLDWTYSFYVAACFALTDATSNPPEPCVVWALYRDAFSLSTQAPAAGAAYDEASRGSKYKDIARSNSDNVQDGINAFLWKIMIQPEKCVWAVNPFRLNERLSVQQGVFLCPGDLTSSFEENLKAGKPSRGTVVRFELSTEPKARAKMLTLLHRMNINYASLFPGLEGFARSLRHKVWAEGTLRPENPSHR